MTSVVPGHKNEMIFFQNIQFYKWFKKQENVKSKNISVLPHDCLKGFGYRLATLTTLKLTETRQLLNVIHNTFFSTHLNKLI